MGGDPDRTALQTDASSRVGGPADTELLDGCRRGDAQAWHALVARFERLVFSVALRNGLDREDAADVTQTVFLSLLRSIDRIEQEERLASWLMTVARRHAWRARSRRNFESFDADDTEPETVGDPIAEWEQGRAVHDVVESLDQPCRDLITALYLDPVEPSYREISDRLGWAVGSLGPMRARCLQRIRQLMRHEEFR